jgi:halogenation protein CepH
MVLIGDAACFVDPVFSSGVHLATYSALLAARSINSVLAGTIDETAAMEEFEHRYRREYGVFYEFLVSFYEMHRDENSYFWQAKKLTNATRPELESFVDLVGGVSSGECAFTSAEALAERMHSHSQEFSDAVGKMADGGDGGWGDMLNSSVVRESMAEGSRVQMHALLGDDAEQETPLFVGGLIPSRDGLSWVHAPAE